MQGCQYSIVDFHYCIQINVTFQHLSLTNRPIKPNFLLLSACNNYKLHVTLYIIRRLSLTKSRSSSTSSLRSTLSTSQTGTTNFRRASGSCPLKPLHIYTNPSISNPYLVKAPRNKNHSIKI